MDAAQIIGTAAAVLTATVTGVTLLGALLNGRR